MRSEQSAEQSLLNISQTDHPCGYAVDRSVEIVRCDEHSVECVMCDDLLSNLLCFIVKENGVVAVPADGAGDMKCNLLIEKEKRRNFVGNNLGRMIVTVIHEGSDTLAVYI